MPTYGQRVDPSADSKARLTNQWPHHRGPWKYNGNLYGLLVDNNNGATGTGADHTARMWKSTDEGYTWAEVDGGNRKLLKYEPGSFPRSLANSAQGYQSGSTLKIAYLEQESATDEEAFVILTSFDMSTDTWGADITGGPATQLESGFPNRHYAFSISPRGSGTVVAYVQFEVVSAIDRDRVAAMVWDGAAWGGEILMDGQAGLTDHFNLGASIDGESGRTHIFAKFCPHAGPTGTHNLVHWTLDSSDVSHGPQTVTGIAKSFDEGMVGVPINAAGEIICPYVQPGVASSELMGVARATSADSPTWTIQTVGTDTAKSPSFGTSFTSVYVAYAGGMLLALWPNWNGAVGSHIYYSTYSGGVWGAEVSLNGDFEKYIEIATIFGFSDGFGIFYTDQDNSYLDAVAYWQLPLAVEDDFAYQE